MKRLVLFSFIFLFSLNSFAQLSFDVGYHSPNIIISPDFRGISGCVYRAVSIDKKDIPSFKIGWHQKINNFLELDGGFNISAIKYGITFHNPPCRAEFDAIAIFKRLELPIGLNGLIPITDKSTWIISAGLIPQFNLRNRKIEYSSWYKNWMFSYQLGTGYRHLITEKHQLEIGVLYQHALNALMDDEIVYNVEPFKQHSTGLQLGYIYNFK